MKQGDKKSREPAPILWVKIDPKLSGSLKEFLRRFFEALDAGDFLIVDEAKHLDIDPNQLKTLAEKINTGVFLLGNEES